MQKIDEVDKAQFTKALAALNSSLLKIGQFPDTFILSFEEVKEKDSKETQLIVTNGFDKLFRVQLTYPFMLEHRAKVSHSHDRQLE